MKVLAEPWDCLLNGPTLQLEPLQRGSFRVRRKDGGAVLGEVHTADANRPIFASDPITSRSDAAEALQILRPWLDGRALLHIVVARTHAQRFRERRMRRLGLGIARGPNVTDWLSRLGIADDYGVRAGIEPVAEPTLLHPIGEDRHGRRHWLVPAAAQAWRGMRTAAHRDGVELEIVSSFRSVAYQAAIFRRKRARGLRLDQILNVNAAPGFSEHHSGRALDIGTPGCPPAEEPFEDTAAFAWLTRHGADFGFVMSYPRDNPQGFIYEPWHWCWRSQA
ncbi:MAG TPA: D-alanyl-D-alanine carboxypeptidase family protein [Xanthomonadaceae bacterium]|nr:D-alanyl-D-alanine carboxypeptidase family protein [Xanthomonadaceae bacterium]